MRRVSDTHIIWAYEHFVREWAAEGLSAAQIRTCLREEHSLHVGENAVRSAMPRRAKRKEPDMQKATLTDEGVLMPAGTYLVGDPCYSGIGGDKWDEWLTAAADGATGDRILLADVDGRPVIGIHTWIGDGKYPGSDGNLYAVDSGMIGAVPVELGPVTTYDKNSMQTVTFDEPFECLYREESATIVIGHIEIETDPSDECDCGCC